MGKDGDGTETKESLPLWLKKKKNTTDTLFSIRQIAKATWRCLHPSLSRNWDKDDTAQEIP